MDPGLTCWILQFKPGDPLYERYGSIEYTGGWIEEGGEVNFGAYDTLKTRIGRHLNAELSLKRKLFITCNPKKNWMYDTFYKPSMAKNLPGYMSYLACLVQENPFIDPDYIEGLRTTKDKVKRERLLKGNWSMMITLMLYVHMMLSVRYSETKYQREQAYTI